uniref:Putative group vi salivary lipocalin n=1 Tax=Rhipicephalus pulchellus TaxID=72859 RepID=L7LRD6_RHIPC
MHFAIIFFPLFISSQFLQLEGEKSAVAVDSKDTTTADTASETPELPAWANESRLGRYQHAEWVVKDTSTFYLVRATFPARDQLWGNGSTCISRKYSEVNGTYVANFSYLDEGIDKETANLSTSLTSTYNYSIQNAIQYMLPDCALVNDTVIFTSNGTCTLMSVLSEGNTMGCELWISEDRLTNGTVPKCCYFVFDLLCESRVSYEMYNKSQCSETEATVVKSSDISFAAE